MAVPGTRTDRRASLDRGDPRRQFDPIGIGEALHEVVGHLTSVAAVATQTQPVRRREPRRAALPHHLALDVVAVAGVDEDLDRGQHAAGGLDHGDLRIAQGTIRHPSARQR